MKWTMAAVLCVAFTLRASGQSEVQKPPVALTWNYDAQQKTLTLHLANYSGKDISAYNISIAERYTDGSTNPSRLDGIPCFPGEKMEEMLGAMVNFQLSKTEGRHGVAWAGVLVNGQRAPGTVDVERMRREFSNDVFAAGTTRDQVIPEAKDISDVDAVVDMVIYADATADVQNERAFRQLMAMRKGQLLAMEKVNEVVKRVLADPMVDSPISAALAELTPLADVPQGKNRPPEDPAFSQAMYLQGAVKNFQHMQPWRMNMTEREYLTGYLDGQEKRVALIVSHRIARLCGRRGINSAKRSVATAWLTLFRRGTVRMTQPLPRSFILAGYMVVVPLAIRTRCPSLFRQSFEPSEKIASA